MEDKKYYVPELEEFCVGFECERWIESHPEGFWSEVSEPMTHWYLADVLNGTETWIKSMFRVKYLDHEDIESLGWEFKMTKGPCDLFWIGDYSLLFWEKGPWSDKYWLEISNNFTSIFKGECKNKTELKKLMKMLGIL